MRISRPLERKLSDSLIGLRYSKLPPGGLRSKIRSTPEIPRMNSHALEQDTLVEREAVVPLAPRRAPMAVPDAVVASPEPAPPVVVQPLPSPPKADQAFVGVLSALTALLAARLLLLLSIAGAFVLAVMAARSESYLALAVMVAFCCLTTVPLTFLDVITHRRGGK